LIRLLKSGFHSSLKIASKKSGTINDRCSLLHPGQESRVPALVWMHKCDAVTDSHFCNSQKRLNLHRIASALNFSILSETFAAWKAHSNPPSLPIGTDAQSCEKLSECLGNVSVVEQIRYNRTAVENRVPKQLWNTACAAPKGKADAEKEVGREFGGLCDGIDIGCKGEVRM
jgi:hypothetical protein